VSRSNGAIGTFIHNGLDRIDNEIRAYTIENTRPCCKTCNTAKLTLSLDDFRELVIKVYNTLVVQKRSPAVYITELLKIPDTELPKSPIRALVSEWKWLIIKQRKKPWSLTDAQAAWLSQQPCFYCGKKPSQLRKKCIYSGIDRIDSKKGYEIGNVVPCCKSCNIAKNTMTIGQFRDWVTAVYLHWLLPNINTVSNSKPEQPLVAPKTVLTNANLQATAE
jgi:5-methylcytosine-specific restriction endonuclease McrA